MRSAELAKQYVTNQGYKILEEEEGHLSFRYQMNVIHFFGNEDEDNFFFMTLANFTDVTDENIAEVKEMCHYINMQARLVKLYVLNDIILATTEIYYMAEEDFKYQMANALSHLVAVKVMYDKLTKQQ